MTGTSRFIALLLLASAASAYAGKPRVYPNATPYKSSGAAPATGRSGNAKLTARALLDKSGTAELEVSTGALDSSAPPPGNLARVQIKVFQPGSTSLASVDNHNHLSGGGYARYSYPGLLRLQALQVQANVTGIDRRTDVVTVSDLVKLRPDLAIDTVALPARALVNTVVDIAAPVSELNGDVGARADCLLIVDGNQVDAANGIWVDAGGTVTCRFAYEFDTVGKHRVTVTAGDVVPADFDPSNNRASATIDITSPAEPLTWSASVNDTSLSSGSYYKYWSDSSQPNPDYLTETSEQSRHEATYFWGSSPSYLKFPLATLRSTQASGSSTIVSIQDSRVAPDFSYDDVYLNGNRHAEACVTDYGADDASVSLCSSSQVLNGVTYNVTTLSSGRDAGAVTYHSDGYCHVYAWGCGWTRNSDTSSAQGSLFDVSAGVQFDVTAVDANGATLHAAPFVPVTSRSAGSGSPDQPRCTTSGATRTCSASWSSETILSGAVSGHTP